MPESACTAPPQPIIMYLREHGESSIGQMKKDGLEGVGHWIRHFQEDGAVSGRRIGKHCVLWSLTW